MAFYPIGSSGEGSEDVAEKFRDLFGPGQVDETIRRAIHFCWMSLPKERRNASQIRRIVDRALKDFREDSEHFGQSS